MSTPDWLVCGCWRLPAVYSQRCIQCCTKNQTAIVLVRCQLFSHPHSPANHKLQLFSPNIKVAPFKMYWFVFQGEWSVCKKTSSGFTTAQWVVGELELLALFQSAKFINIICLGFTSCKMCVLFHTFLIFFIWVPFTHTRATDTKENSDEVLLFICFLWSHYTDTESRTQLLHRQQACIMYKSTTWHKNSITYGLEWYARANMG